MQQEIIPAILTKKKKEFMQRLELASKLSKTIQIDIMDGLFVDNETPKNLNNGRWFAEYKINNTDKIIPDIELHLMVLDPWTIIREWNEFAEVKRVIWHVEVPIDHAELNEVVHGLDIETGLAINPDTKQQEITPYINPKKIANIEFFNHILVMGVVPGFSGQTFIPGIIKTIRNLRKKYSTLSIGVDGGVNEHNIKQLKQAGANIFNAAGAIFKTNDPKKTYQQLKKLIS